ncbi:hypothetical protein SEPCBS119000_004840 [Sporothrix epigloea]|uniref:F-box domain-containing protein n=1 Tax=Sporothrix epigloea TaxID=1892477 RepID=A0ABP0DUH5_9PEZI
MALVQAGPLPVSGRDCLSRLPAELLLRITRDLTTTELCAVRSCSRSLECALRDLFLREFFWRRQFMLTEFSLQTLLAIAQHPLMSQSLRHVSIGVEEFVTTNCSPPDDEVQSVNLLLDAARQRAMLANGRALQLLATAFSLLPNLQTVQLRDRPSYTRHRDGPSEAWSSYGLRSAQEQLGRNANIFLTKGASRNLPSRVFALVMTALAKSNARPANIEVLMHSSRAGLFCSAFDPTPLPCLSLPGASAGNGADASVLPILAGLRRLHLRLQFIFHPNGINPFDPTIPPISRRNQQAGIECLPLYAWLAHCPNIRWLRLHLQKEARHHNDTFLRQLAAPLPASYPFPPGSTASRNITMPFASHLRRLELGFACCRRGVLEDLLSRFPALEDLTLFVFSLVNENHTAEPAYNVWCSFLDTLAKSPLGTQMTHMSLNKVGIVNHSDIKRLTHKTHVVNFGESQAIEYVAGIGKPMAYWLQGVSINVEREMKDNISSANDLATVLNGNLDSYSDCMSDDLNESEMDDDEDDEDESGS